MASRALEGNTLARGSGMTVPPEGIADTALVRAAQTGDREAFGLLYRRYARIVHGVLLAHVPHPAAEDLLQDVFLQAMRKVGGLRDASRFGPWLRSISRNVATDYHRRAFQRGGEPREFSEEECAPRGQHPRADVEAQEILGLILRLPEAYRETLVLRLVEGMTGPEIAERTGLKHGSVRVNLHRGFEQLRELLRKKDRP